MVLKIFDLKKTTDQTPQKPNKERGREIDENKKKIFRKKRPSGRYPQEGKNNYKRCVKEIKKDKHSTD